ncbi:exopolyphosphatase [Nesterenkonia lacusekhoensis]|uniref:Exopolyphosphatase/guanosine-5'-triphosphate, 3'-diphosphate pyrophosphatase n=1 Tax=Nesterenkonia lacusekhoensis TaxID=150832 RepID=A0ABS4T2Q7_9MICC|nr:Ppx/GppA phosphatase family protein [Nesterenkonia lacusekhoensis]MBP2318736.1 exopolyphosphatase/guanosine-5'-triphosphate,3'-diphosphate pyrophosphatase [Nesterenkonia lacusekhoensis]
MVEAGVAQAAARRTAAIDCGTNSIRLLIADVVDGVLTDVVREMTVVRLGEGVDRTGEFSAAALQRTFAAVDRYAELIRHHGVAAQNIRFVATSASRDVENRDEFVAGVSARLSSEEHTVVPEVIPGSEEAELSFSGAAATLATHLEGRRVLVVDLGGGSTEFVLGTIARDDSGRLSAEAGPALSTDMGCVRFTERHLHSDPPTQEEISAARAEIRRFLEEVGRHVPLEQAEAVVGVAGTVTTITAHALGLESYDPDRIDSTELSIDDVRNASLSLLHAPRDERAQLPFMHPGRVDVIGSGALIWSTVLEHIHEMTSGRVTAAAASEHDILDGIALSAGKGEG